MKKETWILKNNEGEIIKTYSLEKGKEVDAIYYGTLKEVINSITLKEYKEMATLEILNKGNDKVNHRPITKEQIYNML